MCSCNKNKPRHAMPSSPKRTRTAAPKLSEPQIRQMALRRQVNDAAIKSQQQKIKITKQRIIKDKLSH